MARPRDGGQARERDKTSTIVAVKHTSAGDVVTDYKDGVHVEQWNDGTIIAERKGDTWQINPDHSWSAEHTDSMGTKWSETHYANGDIVWVARARDGTVVTRDNKGNFTRKDPDGKLTTWTTDGNHTVEFPDGSRAEYYGNNGLTYTPKNGDIIIVFEDGSIRIIHPDTGQYEDYPPPAGRTKDADPFHDLPHDDDDGDPFEGSETSGSETSGSETSDGTDDQPSVGGSGAGGSGDLEVKEHPD